MLSAASRQPQQTSGGTGPGRLAQEVRAVSTHYPWAYAPRASLSCRRSCRRLPLLDDLPAFSDAEESLLDAQPMEGVLPISGIHSTTSSQMRPYDGRRQPASMPALGVDATHDWCVMLPLSQRVQPGAWPLVDIGMR